MNLRFRAIWAVLKRNFQSYFSNPTGYVFITMFVVATGFVAFFGEEFFAANVADLAYLNKWMPWLLVVFVPAITMGAWAEERKLGTHELLLTLPVRDIEVVLGKYFAALAVYTVSLLFSAAHAIVLTRLGKPDAGLLAANYFGHWVLGAALIPLGLLASSITSNITVAFIVGTAFSAAGVFAEKLTMLALGPGSRLAKGMGVQTHFEGFTLGVVSLPDLLFFLMLAASMLYLNMIMVGRRHWSGGRDGPHMGWHQLARGVAVVVAAAAVGLLAGRWLGGARLDATSERINSPAPQTISLLKALPKDAPIYVRAFVSEEVPEEYIPVRDTLLRTLKTIQSHAGDRITVQVNTVEPYSQMARDAEDMYGIKPRKIYEQTEGRYSDEDLFLGVAATCGPRQQIIPFFEKGLSVEYELVRSIRAVAPPRVTVETFISENVPPEYQSARDSLRRIVKASESDTRMNIEVRSHDMDKPDKAATEAAGRFGISASTSRAIATTQPTTRPYYLSAVVSSGDRKQVIPLFSDDSEEKLSGAIREFGGRRKIGILKTDAALMGSMGMGGPMGGGGSPPWQIVEELRKQYDVVEVDASTPIKDVDVLIAAQPCGGPQQPPMGYPPQQPTGLSPQQQMNFADYVLQGKPVLLLVDPNPMEMARQSMFGLMPSLPQDDLGWLFGRLGVVWKKDRVVCDGSVRLERFPKLSEVWVFASASVGGMNLTEAPTRRLSEKVAFFMAGSLEYTTPSAWDMAWTIVERGQALRFTPLVQTGTLAGLVDHRTAFEVLSSDRGTVVFPPGAQRYALAARISGPAGFYYPQFGSESGMSLQATAAPANVNMIAVADLDLIGSIFFSLRNRGQRDLRFDNITFILNCIDELAGDKDLLELRTWQPTYRLLAKIDEKRRESREKRFKEQSEAEEAAKKQVEEAENRLKEAVKTIDERKDIDDRQKDVMKDQVQVAERKRFDANKTEIESRKQDRIRRAREEESLSLRKIENRTRQWAIVLPALPPVFIGLVIFGLQQIRERRSVPLSRSMRKNP